jgi:DNA-binding NarL/FixJ family response regulator
MPTVLILESDPLSRVHYLRALGGLPGACVVASSSEAEAQTLVSAITPDVVIADARWLQQGRAGRDFPSFTESARDCVPGQTS